jgi:hypothetical protein
VPHDVIPLLHSECEIQEVGEDILIALHRPNAPIRTLSIPTSKFLKALEGFLAKRKGA